jgi:hypothetical protein
MALPLESNNNLTGKQSLGLEKKIEFAQKLPAGELEGQAAAKGSTFNFLKNVEPRKPGEATPVRLMKDQPEPEEDEDDDKPPKKGANAENFLSQLTSFFSKINPEKNSSRVLEVNLVKGEIVKFFDWQRGILILLVAIFVSMAILSGAYWGISWWETNNQAEQNGRYLQQYYKLSKEINALNPQVDQILIFKAKLDQVNFLLERHIYWTNFFNFLEDNTLSNVYFSGFSGSLDGKYSLSATTDNFNAIDAQTKKLLASPFIKNAQVDSGSVGGEKGKPIITFGLSFSLDPKIFLK